MISLVQIRYTSGQTFTWTNFAGDFLFLALGGVPDRIITGIADTAGNLWTLIGGPGGANACAYVANCKAKVGNVVTISGYHVSGATNAIDAIEYAGVSSSMRLDVFSISNTAVPSMIFTKADHELLIGASFSFPGHIVSGNYNLRDNNGHENGVVDILDGGPAGLTSLPLNFSGSTSGIATFFMAFSGALPVVPVLPAGTASLGSPLITPGWPLASVPASNPIASGPNFPAQTPDPNDAVQMARRARGLAQVNETNSRLD